MKKNVKKMGQFSGAHISCELLSRFSSNLVCRVTYKHGGHNICELNRNQPSGYIEIRGAENGELAVPVNNTLVHHLAFLAADT